MISSSALMLVLGILMLFLPQELLTYCGSEAKPFLILIVQAAGALYLGFAILNWMASGNLIGGIYSRPVSLGNLMHFWIVAAVLLKAVALGERNSFVLMATLFYTGSAAWFGVVVFTHPIRASSGQNSPVE
jgi:hypothetical protein